MRNVLLSELLTQACGFDICIKYKSFSSEKIQILQNLVLSYQTFILRNVVSLYLSFSVQLNWDEVVAYNEKHPPPRFHGRQGFVSLDGRLFFNLCWLFDKSQTFEDSSLISQVFHNHNMDYRNTNWKFLLENKVQSHDQV